MFYNEVAAYYKRLFGKDRVTLFTFEDFVGERDGFTQRLSGCLGIDADRSQHCITNGSFNAKPRSSSGSGYHITANEYLLDKLHRHNWKIANFPRSLRIVLKRVPFSKLSFELNSRQRSSIVSLYSESNRLLAEDFDIELGKPGYYWAADTAVSGMSANPGFYSTSVNSPFCSRYTTSADSASAG